MLDRDEDHFVGKVAQKALIIKGSDVLLVRHIGNSEFWELPGGRLNINEEPKEGLAREVVEELGVEIKVGDAVAVDQFVMKRTSEPHIAIIYKAFLNNEKAAFLIDPDEVAEVVWVNGETWRQYPIFSNYERVLEVYFNQLFT